MDTDYPAKPQNADGASADGESVSPGSLQADHETTDVSLKGLTIFGFALLISLVGILAAVAVFFGGFKWLNTRLNQARASAEPGASSLVRATPAYAGPLIQVKPEEDLRWMRDHNATDLQSYGWVDRQAGVVRMPVARAMDLLAERGLPPVSPGKTLEDLQSQRAQPQVFGQALRP